jgi:hypothetical protein
VDEDNDGRFPDDSPVEVRYPRSQQEKDGDRSAWPWLPGSIVEQCGPDEWYVYVEVRERAVLRDGRSQLVRRARGPRAKQVAPVVPAEVEQAARAAYVASVASGGLLSQRAIADRFGLSRRKAAQLVTAASMQANGHDPDGRAA